MKPMVTFWSVSVRPGDQEKGGGVGGRGRTCISKSTVSPWSILVCSSRTTAALADRLGGLYWAALGCTELQWGLIDCTGLY